MPSRRWDASSGGGCFHAWSVGKGRETVRGLSIQLHSRRQVGPPASGGVRRTGRRRLSVGNPPWKRHGARQRYREKVI